MDFLETVLYFVIAIGILIIVHEFGHFIAARLTKMRVDIFSIGMGYRLFGWNKISGFNFGKLSEDWDGQGHTDYRLSLFPIGGYVKIVGMIDESMDADFASSEPQPWEFRSKNTFSKIITISAGVIMNFLLAVIIFGGLFYFIGQKNYETTTIGYLNNDSFLYDEGLRSNDKIVDINGKKIGNWNSLMENLTLADFGKDKIIDIERNNKPEQITIKGGELVKALENKNIGEILPSDDVYIVDVMKDSPAEKAGLKSGDLILSLDGVKIRHNNELVWEVKRNKGRTVPITWKRGSELMHSMITPSAEGSIGVQMDSEYNLDFQYVHYGLITSIGMGFDKSVDVIDLFVGSIRQMIKGNLSVRKSIGGPIEIARQSKKQAETGLGGFLSFIATLSVVLAVINILPVPALDGGHLVFIIIEGIIRREVPVKIKMAFQQVGMILLLLLMAFIIYNDITRL